ncbi:MAG: arginine--tRNA ligase [Candidatus Neomarinimicrobiota bacterium]|nr:arginine--tRNA ligase [Candidatus Neomarinimicrobiota bacterium]RKY45522.1 MAG: arginine--tRNA ligase [Candidatus Neomarinimicrobiota bacterium]
MEKIRNLLYEILKSKSIDSVDIRVERPKNPEHGNFSTNLPLLLSKRLKKGPLEIAREIVSSIDILPPFLSKVEVQPPGFINFFLSPRELRNILKEALEKGEDFGKTNIGKSKKALVEFVSANPTGPLTVGHGRQAVLGDSIARILEFHGYNVEREYYYNDAGRQMRILGYSTYVRYRQILGYNELMPEDYYQGEYIFDVAKKIFEEYGDSLKDDKENPVFVEMAERMVFSEIRNTLKRLGVEFDSFYNEKDLYEKGSVNSVIERLKEKGALYEKDGALWFKAGDYGGTGDKVLWKSVVDEATYRLPDIAYHETKIKRGYDLIIDIFGADHHATYPDVLAGLRALGYDTDNIVVLLHQFVTLVEGGRKIKMSTRKATYVTLSELIDELGKDVVRYFFLMRNMNSHLNFDLKLARTEGEENPVYYLQYAHARIASILRNAVLRGMDTEDCTANLDLLNERESLKLMDIIGEFKEIMQLCLKSYEPHHLTTYLQKLATEFHKFYTVHRVLGAEIELSKARLQLVKAVKNVLKSGLGILGITAPEQM